VHQCPPIVEGGSAGWRGRVEGLEKRAS